MTQKALHTFAYLLTPYKELKSPKAKSKAVGFLEDRCINLWLSSCMNQLEFKLLLQKHKITYYKILEVNLMLYNNFNTLVAVITCNKDIKGLYSALGPKRMTNDFIKSLKLYEENHTVQDTINLKDHLFFEDGTLFKHPDEFLNL